jgi:hypothetical protein
MSQSLEEVMAQFTANPEQLQTHLLEANAMSNELTKAVEKLYVLAQRKGSVSEYLTQFDTWAGHTEYNNVALGDAFYRGLSEHIKDMIMAAGRPKDLATLKSEALKYDQRVQECLRQPRSDSDAPNATYSDDPMDIVSVRMGCNKKGVKAPLTADKKERRRRDKLCGYCAKADCPGGVSQDPALCPLVIAKEDAKRQRCEGNGNRLA